MIRLVIKTVNFGEAANVQGAQVQTWLKSFDCDLPDVEKYLTTNRNQWQSAELIGIEVLETAERIGNGE